MALRRDRERLSESVITVLPQDRASTQSSAPGSPWCVWSDLRLRRVSSRETPLPCGDSSSSRRPELIWEGGSEVAERIADLERARQAILRGSWAVAHEGFRALDASSLPSEDLERFADAAWW